MSKAGYTLLPRLLGLGEKGEGAFIHIVLPIPLLRVSRLTTRKDGGSCLPYQRHPNLPLLFGWGY